MSERSEQHLRAVPGMREAAPEQLPVLVAVAELANKLGLDEATYAALFEGLKSLSEEDAELAWKTIGDMNELLVQLNIDAQD